MNKKMIRVFYYVLGILFLAMGLILNTKTELGVSAIISVPYCVSEITNYNFGNATLIAYALFVAAEFVINGKNRNWLDLLQLPFSLIFTRLMNVFSAMIQIEHHSFAGKFALLLLAIICTGIGAAMMVNMKIVANPGDAIVAALAERWGKPMGFAKNVFDISCVTCACVIGLAFTGGVVGIGIGTLASMILVGRTIAVFNHFFKEKMAVQAGFAATKEP